MSGKDKILKDRIFRKRSFLGVLFALGVLLLAGCGQGASNGQVDFTATLNDVDLTQSAPNDPVRLSDDETATLELELTNVSNQDVTVRFIQFEGQVIDMVFLTYDTGVRFEIAPGDSIVVPPIQLDFFDLGGQATGYVRGNVHLFNPDRELVGTQEVFLDADAEGFSTLALFNLLLLIATVVGLGWNLMRMAQRRLPANRFVRAMRFLAIGAAAGITLAVAMSTLRIWPLDTFGWVLFTVIGAVIGYLVGFVLPGGDDLVDLEEEREIEAMLAAQAAQSGLDVDLDDAATRETIPLD